MAAIVGFKERNVGREEGEDGFLYFIFHCMKRFDGMQQVELFKGFWLICFINKVIAIHAF